MDEYTELLDKFSYSLIGMSHKDLCKAFFGDNPTAWQLRCEIIPASHKQPILVRCGRLFLRYSKGPSQRFFWDTYGDDMMTVALAFRALTLADPPPSLWCVESTRIGDTPESSR